MRFVGDIALDAEVRAIASGTIGDGVPVVVNSDGTVSAGGNISPTAGSEVVIDTNDSGGYSSIVYAGQHLQGSSDDNKVIIVFRDTSNSNYGTAVVGTVSGTSISFGSAVVFESAQVSEMECCLDTLQGNINIFYRDNGNSNYGTGIAGKIDGTSISFGTPVVFESATTTHISCDFDNYNNQTLVAYKDSGNSNYGTAIVATAASGPSVEFTGSPAVFESAKTQNISVTYEFESNRFLISYVDWGNSNYGTSIVATIGASQSVSFGTAVVFSSANSDHISSICDTANDKIVVGYTNTGKIKAIVGTISGTSVSFGTETQVSTNTAYNSANRSMAYSPDTGRVLIAYFDSSDASHGKIVLGTVSGTSISFDTPFKFNAGTTYYVTAAYNKGTDNFVLHYEDYGNSGYLTSIVIDEGGPNITSENFIGFAHAAYADGQKATIKTTGSIARNIPQQPAPQALGTAVVFNEADTTDGNSVFDPDTNKIIWAGRDEGNSNYGTAIVATIDPSDNSVSFGSKVVFNSAASIETDITYDTNSNKVVIAWANGTSNAQAIVGTVSGTSISFGSAETFNARTSKLGIAFDSNSNKVVIAYEDFSNSKHGTAIVGTVSGTSISFGSESVFESAETGEMDIAFDSNVNKMLIVYKDSDNSSHGTAIVGTVSGTSISYGSAAVFHAAATDSFHKGTVFDTNSNKFVITYNDSSSGSDVGTAKVATISGTSVSFGSASVVPSAKSPFNNSFDSTNNKIILSYKDTNNKGSTCIGTISGTSISFGSAVVFENSTTTTPKGNAYDSNSKRALFTFQDGANSGHGTGIVLSPAQNADLTIGQQYFVQTDGTLDTSADDPSVIAGTAIGASDIIVKG